MSATAVDVAVSDVSVWANADALTARPTKAAYFKRPCTNPHLRLSGAIYWPARRYASDNAWVMAVL